MKLTIQLPFHEDQYTIETECRDIVDTLYRTYGMYCRFNTKTHGREYRIKKMGQGYCITYEEQIIPTENPVQHLHNEMFEKRQIASGIFALHAGGVSHEGKAYVFCAPTTTGKTTLTTYLVERGREYISDDCVFIDMKDLSVYPSHTPIHLREGGYTILKECGFAPDPIEKADQRYVFTPKRLSPPKMEIGKIIFLTRTSDRNTIKSINKAEAFQRLLVSPITVYPITKDYLAFLNRLAPYCYEIEYSDMEFVMRQLV